MNEVIIKLSFLWFAMQIKAAWKKVSDNDMWMLIALFAGKL